MKSATFGDARVISRRDNSPVGFIFAAFLILKKAPFVLLALLLLFNGANAARAQSNEKQWHVLIEPKFMHPPVSYPIPGAERTVLVPGWVTDDEVHYFSKKDWDALGLDWKTFQTKS